MQVLDALGRPLREELLPAGLASARYALAMRGQPKGLWCARGTAKPPPAGSYASEGVAYAWCILVSR